MKRFGAFIIDIILGTALFGITIGNAYDSVTGSLPESKLSDFGMRDVVALVFLVTFILSYVYLFEKFAGGTIGQRLFRLQSAR